MALPNATTEDRDCLICWDELSAAKEESVSCHVCRSIYHKSCFDTYTQRKRAYLLVNVDRPRCPLCRTDWSSFTGQFGLQILLKVIMSVFACWTLLNLPIMIRRGGHLIKMVVHRYAHSQISEAALEVLVRHACELVYQIHHTGRFTIAVVQVDDILYAVLRSRRDYYGLGGFDGLFHWPDHAWPLLLGLVLHMLVLIVELLALSNDKISRLLEARVTGN